MFDLILIGVILGGLAFLVAAADEDGRTRRTARTHVAAGAVIAALIILLARRPTP